MDGNRSFSEGLEGFSMDYLNEESDFESDRDYALKILQEGIVMEGKPLSREQIYQERLVDFS